MDFYYGNYCSYRFGWRLDIKKHKVLIVGGFPGLNNKIFGGIVTSCSTLLKSSFSKKFEVLTIDSTQRSNPIPPLVIRLFFAVIRTLKYLIKLIVQRPKVIILFPSIGASLLEKGLMSWIAFFLRIPVFMFPRGGPLLDQVKVSSFNRLWVKWAFRAANKVLCQGPAWKTFALETLGFSDHNCPIIFNWTATDRLLSIGKQKLKTKRKKPLNILYLGWLEEEKGIFDFIESCSNIKQENKFKISIAGGGSREYEAKELVRKRGIQDLVTFFGWIEGTHLEELLDDSDILVLPSWAEGFPNAVIEAMASGLAVIVTSVGNIPDILTHDLEALLVPPKNEVSLTSAILRLIDDDHLRHTIALKGHEFSAENFSVEKASLKLEKLIYSVIE